MEIERRDFLKTTGKALTVGAAALALGGKILGANDRVRIAVCGVRGRGHDHIRGFAHVPGVELTALCDVDENVLNERLGGIEKMGLPRPKSYVDVRKLLEDKDIDAISIAT
ncbi:MAG: Gfo/Idh/MocA family oxidoreductase, partial [Candidatus Acidiferrum sp.]